MSKIVFKTNASQIKNLMKKTISDLTERISSAKGKDLSIMKKERKKLAVGVMNKEKKSPQSGKIMFKRINGRIIPIKAK